MFEIIFNQKQKQGEKNLESKNHTKYNSNYTLIMSIRWSIFENEEENKILQTLIHDFEQLLSLDWNTKELQNQKKIIILYCIILWFLNRYKIFDDLDINIQE